LESVRTTTSAGAKNGSAFTDIGSGSPDRARRAHHLVRDIDRAVAPAGRSRSDHLPWASRPSPAKFGIRSLAI
jgi:hypothetical protein